MTELNQVYKCEVCGNIVEVTHSGVGTLVCCDQPMVLQIEHKSDEGFEKHLPALSFEGNTITISIGDIPHPMEEKHYIEWVEYIVDGTVHRKYLNPSDEPKVMFEFKESNGYIVRAYCNVHGLWELRM